MQKNGEACIERLTFADRPALSEQFDADGVKTAIQNIKDKQIDYPEFLRKIMLNGCASYSVYIDGRFVSYTGRKGECHIEKFPQ